MSARTRRRLRSRRRRSRRRRSRCRRSRRRIMQSRSAPDVWSKRLPQPRRCRLRRARRLRRGGGVTLTRWRPPLQRAPPPAPAMPPRRQKLRSWMRRRMSMSRSRRKRWRRQPWRQQWPRLRRCVRRSCPPRRCAPRAVGYRGHLQSGARTRRPGRRRCPRRPAPGAARRAGACRWRTLAACCTGRSRPRRAPPRRMGMIREMPRGSGERMCWRHAQRQQCVCTRRRTMNQRRRILNQHCMQASQRQHPPLPARTPLAIGRRGQ